MADKINIFLEVLLEVSKPHYHPGPDFDIEVTKKRDLSVPPHWVANERIEKDGVSYAIVMPARAEELFEVNQEPHIHLPEYIDIIINGKVVRVKVKVEPYEFVPAIHLDQDFK